MHRSRHFAFSVLLAAAPAAFVACADTSAEEVETATAEVSTSDLAGLWAATGGQNAALKSIRFTSVSASAGTYEAVVSTGAGTLKPEMEALAVAKESGTFEVAGTRLTLRSSTGTKRAYVVRGATSKVLTLLGGGTGRALRLQKKSQAVAPVVCEPGFHPEVAESSYGAGQTTCVPDLVDCNQIAIDKRTELSIVHPAVTDSALATTAGGAWTLGALVRNMVPGNNATEAAAMFENMLRSFSTPSAAGALDAQPRSLAAMNNFIANLPKTAGGQTDVTRLHEAFRLSGIVYRPDIQIATNDGDLASKVGEGRFVFLANTSFSLILEYNLPVISEGGVLLSVADSRKVWAQRWHKLSLHTPFSAAYIAELATITAGFAGQNVKVSGVATPNGTSLSQLRTNEINNGSPWQLREWNLRFAPSGAAEFAPATTKENLAREVRLNLPSANGQALRTEFLGLLQANEGAVQTGAFSIPSQFLGPVADTFNGGAYQTTFTGAGLQQATVDAIVSNSCNGCHTNATGTTPSFGFLHMTLGPTSGDASDLNVGQEKLSSFVQTDLTKRLDVERLLLCSGQSVPAKNQPAVSLKRSRAH